MDSVLNSIKKLLGITEEYTHFDADIILHINSAFMILTQLGVGPSEGFRITDENTAWDEFIPIDDDLEAVKTYVYLKVKLVFDPPQSSIVTESYNKMISEYEWRLNGNADMNKSK